MPVYNLQRDSLQWKFQGSRAKIQIFAGAYANGKTTAQVVKALGLCINYPGSNGLIARSTYPKLNDTIRKEFLTWCPRDWIKRRPTDKDNTVYLANDTIVNFRYIQQRGKQSEDGSTTSNLLSATYDWIVVDQIEDPEISHKDFIDLAGRLRGSTPYVPDGQEDATMPSSGPRWLMLSCNPSQNWFYRKIVYPYIVWRDKGIVLDDLIVDPESKQPIIELFEGDLYSNRHNLEDDFIRQQEAVYKGQQRDRYVLGKWAAYEGMVYSNFDVVTNVITKAQALEHLDDCIARHVRVRALEGYDFGIVKPSCYLLAFVDDVGRIIILDGFYEPEFDYQLQGQAIADIRSKYLGRLIFEQPISADPSIFRPSVVAGHRITGTRTIAQLLSQGSPPVQMRPAANDITQGIAKVSAYINGLASVTHLLTGETPGSMLYVVDELQFFMTEIQAYYWKRNPMGQFIDEPMDRDDHAMDTVKYMLSRMPMPSKIVVPKSSIVPEWMYWREMADNDAR